MKLGLIGYPLGHSWSPEIHGLLIGEDYVLWELKKEELDAFFEKRDFDGINVTIPYKKEVMKYLDEIEENAKAIGAINCIKKEKDKLIGYNTDYLGLEGMLEAHGISLENRNVLLLGNGGVGQACKQLLKKKQAHVTIVDKNQTKECISLEKARKIGASFDCLFQATPVGMYPNVEESPIDLKDFPNLTTIVDCIANPLRTKLYQEASAQGIEVLGGFEMLVRQAYCADLIFTNASIPEEKLQECLHTLTYQKRNIALIGMPTSGKTTIGKELAKVLDRDYIDIDEEIEKEIKMPIRKCFEEYGEDCFREVETRCTKKLIAPEGKVISCGGGVIKKEENMTYLKANSIILFLDRDLEHLYGSSSRPLSQTKEDLEHLYQERYPLYQKYADMTILNHGTMEETIAQIRKKLEEL
ncbi:MAG: shikimate dehydrogenase [Solobacterium sp.]|nr:shikimate dehydrogenase [Solobacterium sp.]